MEITDEKVVNFSDTFNMDGQTDPEILDQNALYVNTLILPKPCCYLIYSIF